MQCGYCNLWPARLYNNFQQCLINGLIFEKKLLDTKCVFFLIFLQLLFEPFRILRKLSDV